MKSFVKCIFVFYMFCLPLLASEIKEKSGPELELILSIETIAKESAEEVVDGIYFYIEDNESILIERHFKDKKVERVYSELLSIKERVNNLNIEKFNYKKEKESSYLKAKESKNAEIYVTSYYDGEDIKVTVPTSSGLFIIYDDEVVDRIKYLSVYNNNFQKLNDLIEIMGRIYGLAILRNN